MATVIGDLSLFQSYRKQSPIISGNFLQFVALCVVQKAECVPNYGHNEVGRANKLSKHTIS